MRSMHVVLVTTELNRGEELYPGGLASYVYNVANGLIQNGHKATIILSGRIDQQYQFRGIPVIECIPSHGYLPGKIGKYLHRKIPETYGRLVKSWGIRKSIIKLIPNGQIDIIQYTNWKATGFFKIKHPSLIRISSYDPLFDNNPRSIHLDKRLAQWVEKICIKRFKHVIGPGDYLANIIQAELKLSKPIQIIPTPYSPTEANKDRDFRTPGMKLVLYAGTLSRFKGVELLCEIIDYYLSRFNDTCFLLCGKAGTMNGQSVRNTLIQLIEKYPGHIRWYEHVPKPDLMRAYQQSDAVLITSLIDNFPNTALEAMSQGATVFASEKASLGILIKDGLNGYIMSSRMADDWTTRIRHHVFELHDTDRNEMKMSMPNTLQSFTMKNSMAKLLSYYQNVMVESR